MAYIPRSSLIPNEASGVIPVQMKRRRSIHAFGLLASLIFVLSLLGAVGIFLYKGYLEKDLEVAKQNLGNLSIEEDNQDKIEEIRVYNNKLRVAHDLLDNHISPVAIFEEIENSTKETVQFQSLIFAHDPGFDAVLTLTGATEAFAGVALQKMQILEDSVFSEFVLEDITTAIENESETEGTVPEEVVNFSVVGVFKKEIIQYKVESDATLDTTDTVSEVPALEVEEGSGTTTAEVSPEDTVPEGVTTETP